MTSSRSHNARERKPHARAARGCEEIVDAAPTRRPARGPIRTARPARAEPRPGFTLVELLVVLGIVAVLISLTLPGLESARQSAWQTSSRAHLRDLGVLTGVAMADDRDLLPYWLAEASGSPAGLAQAVVPALRARGADPSTLTAPADPVARRDPGRAAYTSYDYWPGPLMLAYEVARGARDPRAPITRWYESPDHGRWPVCVERDDWYRSTKRLGVYFGDWHVDWYDLPNFDELTGG